jgi:Protein of unknown function (DUF4197)
MTAQIHKLFYILCLTCALPASAFSLGDFTDRDVVTGLKDALNQGTQNAVLRLGKENGFLGYDKVKIPLPPTLKKAEKLMRTFGMKKQADELVMGMNRAAEKAVPEAKALFVDAVKQMSFEDARGILTGGDDAATKYFRKVTEQPLTAKFLPVVTDVTSKIGLADQYNQFAATASQLGVVKKEDAKIEQYVTRKALDGLYVVMAEEEKAVRANPVKAGTDLLKRILGAMKK